MMVRRALLCGVCLAACMVCRADDGERKLSEAERQVVAEGAAWSTITALADGSLGLVYQFAEPVEELPATNVSMQFIRSTDGGKTWSKPVLVSERRGTDGRLWTPRDGGGYIVYQQRNQAIGQLPSGRIICSFCELDYHFDAEGKDANRPGKNYNHYNLGMAFTWSDDLGKTWAPTRRMDSGPVGGPEGVCPHWTIVTLSDGTALMSLYGAYNPEYRGPAKIPEGTHKITVVARSTDNGETWGDFTPIYTGTGKDLYEETALCMADSQKLLAFMRTPKHDVVQFTSTDGGRTWNGPTPFTEPGQQPGGALVLPSGNLLGTWGNRRPPYGAAAMLSTDGGETWQYDKRVSLAWDAPTADCGYANGAVAGDGTIVVTYYAMPNTRDYRRLWTDSKVYVVRFTEEQFKKAAGMN